MTDYEKILARTKRVAAQVNEQIALREANRKTRNKAYRVFCENGFVIGFDTMKEVEQWIEAKILELWNEAKEDYLLFGYSLPCNSTNFLEAENRVRGFYSVRRNSQRKAA